jgi:rubrerythrin
MKKGTIEIHDSKRRIIVLNEETGEKTVNYEGKKIFSKLIEEERSHLELLEVEYKVRKKNFSEDVEEYQNIKEVSGIVN